MISARHLQCLRLIAEEREGNCAPCDSDVLGDLAELGLIERRAYLRVPIECLHLVYRVTPEGREALQTRH